MSPRVSIIVPCYNEEKTICLLLDALFTQSFPHQAMEVIIADGGSTDQTRNKIHEWSQNHPALLIRILDNPRKTIPAALNAALYAAEGEIIVRLDAHSQPNQDYVALAVRDLEEGLGDNVGGVWDIKPRSEHWLAESIAAAAAHPVGVGDARYRFSDRAAYVDTVPFGAFYRSLLDKVGMFDETLLTNEDYEFNTRVRQAGGRIWLDPAIRSIYFARGDLRALARQYWRYGYWKIQMLRRYPGTIRWRQALPPLFILVLVFLILLAPFWILARWAFLAAVASYSFVLLLTGLQLAIQHCRFCFMLGVPLAIATMHFSWGAGFLWGLVHPPKLK